MFIDPSSRHLYEKKYSSFTTAQDCLYFIMALSQVPRIMAILVLSKSFLCKYLVNIEVTLVLNWVPTDRVNGLQASFGGPGLA
jgi:hypothetical protein